MHIARPLLIGFFFATICFTAHSQSFRIVDLGQNKCYDTIGEISCPSMCSW